ncbi:MAG TPA: GGDEF domain-containing protein [Candidatus Mcinerneyibacterium sp.]|nr:GGDEF domain-containing protein [Candidatus Mcinerneyibacterium sp.]
MKIIDNKLISNYLKSTSYEEILSGVLDSLVHNLLLNIVYIAERKQDEFKIKISRGLSSHFIKNFSIDQKNEKIKNLIESKNYVIFDNERVLIEKTNRYCVCFPLLIKKKIVGYIAAARNTKFEDADLNYLQNLAIISAFVLKSNKLENESRNMNIYDSLTSVYKTNYFYLRLNDYLERLKRKEIPFSILYIKYRYIMKLKKVYGLKNLNNVSQKIAEMFKRNVRSVDLIFRYKDDGFLIIFEEIDDEFLMNIINRLKEKINKIISEDSLNANMDIALVNIKNHTWLKKVVKLLEEAIYKSERTGKIVVMDN